MKIKHDKEWYYRAYILAYIVGMFLCIVPTLVAGVVGLPLIANKDATSTLSGVFVVVIITAAFPLYKAFIKLLKSPSVAVICWILFALLVLVGYMNAETLHGLTIVFLWAAIGNTLGVFSFKLSAIWEEKWKYCGEVFIRGGDKP